jgi:hypothetical protein
MKKFFVAVTVLLLANNSFACSICGCGGGNLYLGLYPNFDSKFIGVRHTYSDYKTILKNDHTQFNNNTYKTYELYAGFNLTKKWQLFTFIPYQVNNQLSDDGKSINQGIGDIIILTNYQIHNFHKVINDKKLVTHKIWLGGGIKLNTGSFDLDTHDPATTLADINTQMGTGSADFLLNMRDVYQVENMGIATTANYKINTKNNQGYQFGNKFTFNTIVYYNFNNKNTVITPNFGFLYETVAGNKLDGSLIYLSEGLENGSYHTGGNTLSGVGGVEINVKKLSFGLNIQSPIKQDIAAGQVNLKWKGLIHMTYNF